ncbi:MAG: MFS transporter [Clostridiales bacterium]|nr:MFS transporter [Clostridiales bacterium]
MRVKLYMSAYYLAHAVYQSYMSLYYRSAGLSSSQTGSIFAAVALVSVPAQLLFGMASDRAKKPARVLQILILLSAALLFSQALVRGFGMLLALSALFGFFYTPVQPLSDAAVLSELRAADRPFGPVRLMGAFAFALSSLAFGFALDFGGREKWVVFGAAALLVLAWGMSFLLREGRRERAGVHPFRLLKDGRLVLLLLFTLPAQVTMGYFYAFFPLRFMELPGATGALLGWANVVAAAAEVPFLLISDRMFEKLGAGKIIALSTLALGARWWIAGAARRAWVLVASQALHGLGYIAISVTMALFISRSVPKELRASGQALNSVFSFGLARVIGNALGGLAADAFGDAGGFLLCAGLCAASLALFFPLWKGGLCKSPGNML